MRDPLMTADIRDAMAASYQQAQEEVAVDRIAQAFGTGIGNVRKCKM
jgi:ribosomal protein S24E